MDAGASVRLNGRIVSSKGAGQSKELLVESTEIIGACDPEVCPLSHSRFCWLGRGDDLMVVISYPEEIPTSTCIEGYGSFEVPDYTDCGCDESTGWDDEGMA